jgi:valine--pyruvate aminotransferase
MEALIESDGFQSMVGLYDGPQGASRFREVLCNHLNEQFSWGITPANVSLTNGSQNSFFYLFNALAGEMPDGRIKKILFPLAPEYVGYADSGLIDGMFASAKPIIELVGDDQFKYRVDFEKLVIGDDIAALCLSRPTNPTGNVVSDRELARLDELAQQHGIPLILDNAYGQPFPNIIHTQANVPWNQNIVLCMSLSKLGLPGARTGIVIANEEITDVLSSLSGIITLAPNSVGAALMTRIIEDGEIEKLTGGIIKPFYEHKLKHAQQTIAKYLSKLPVRYHKPEGAFFLWLWMQDLPISSQELYLRLKARHVYAIPGEAFFIGIDESWPHTKQCLRINYAQPEEQLERGLRVLAEELTKLY